MKIFYDTEFLEDGETIQLISIGMVTEDGNQLYLVNKECQFGDFYRGILDNPWMMDNVVPHLPLKHAYKAKPLFRHEPEEPENNYFHLNTEHRYVLGKDEIADKVREFIQTYDDVELWADYAAYDHVALAQLWGPMIQLPEGVPMFTHEFQQFRSFYPKDLKFPEAGLPEHNAINDALILQFRYEYLTRKFNLFGGMEFS